MALIAELRTTSILVNRRARRAKTDRLDAEGMWSSTSSRRHDPRHLIARMVTGPHMALDAGGNQAAGNGRAQQQMVDAQSGVAGERVPEIFPKGVDPLVGMQRPQRVGPAPRELCNVSDGLAIT